MITKIQALYLLNTYKFFFDNIQEGHLVAKNIYHALCAIRDDSNFNSTLNEFVNDPQLCIQKIINDQSIIKQGFQEIQKEEFKDNFGDLLGDMKDPLLNIKSGEENKKSIVVDQPKPIDFRLLTQEFKEKLKEFLINKKHSKELINASQKLYKAVVQTVGIEPEKYMDKIKETLATVLEEISVDSTQIKMLVQLSNQLSHSKNDNNIEAFHAINYTANCFSEKNKVQNLKLLCDDYKEHLIKNINREFKKLPVEVIQHYLKKDSQEINFDEIVIKYGCEIDDNLSLNKKCTPSLLGLIEKYIIVHQLHSPLSEDNVDDQQKIKKFQEVLTEEYKETLKTHRTSKGILFLENVLHVLSAGLYSKLTKGTFQFWKSKGESFSEQVVSTSKSQHR